MEEKKFACQFATMTMTGEKPDVELHAAAKHEEDGIAATVSMHGHGRDLAYVVSAIVKDFGKSLREKDSIVAAAAFIDIINDALMEGCGMDALAMAAMMARDKVEKSLAGMSDEEAEADAESV